MQLNQIFILNLHYNGSNNFLFINATKIHQFKATNSYIKHYALRLGDISKKFTIVNMEKDQMELHNSFLLILIQLILTIF